MKSEKEVWMDGAQKLDSLGSGDSSDTAQGRCGGSRVLRR